ncbi:DUF1127 domain-containing protein [Falsihalocynthiibacter sp. BN13B15]|uniref:DUF1127 domain-containing protein n=1 Tax=Falsihalocynthiibacter sp. BN13B15 TaxID=3240871 RepID=UPI00351017F5
MKNNVSTAGIPNFWPQLRHAAGGFASFFAGCASTVYYGLARFVANLQIGRMESVLRAMSDEELAQIGITRSDIKRHAKFLATYEYDGL